MRGPKQPARKAGSGGGCLCRWPCVTTTLEASLFLLTDEVPGPSFPVLSPSMDKHIALGSLLVRLRLALTHNAAWCPGLPWLTTATCCCFVGMCAACTARVTSIRSLSWLIKTCCTAWVETVLVAGS